MSHVLKLVIRDKVRELEINEIRTVHCAKPDAVEIIGVGLARKRLLWIPVANQRQAKALVAKIQAALNPVVSLDEFYCERVE